MRQRIKQTLSPESFWRRKLNTRLLHSDKSTYFYKHKLNYSGTAPLVLASLALLFLISCLVNPVGRAKKTYAETVNYPAVEGSNNAASISFTLNGNDIDGSEVSTEVVPDDISYISNDLKITTNNIGKFSIVIQSASDNGNLTNSDNGAIIAPISSATTPNNFTNNTWGYALSDNTTTADSALTYNPLPAFQEEPTAQYAKENPDNGNYDLKLVFAAKIGSSKPAGHYKTTALVSVVAEAKELVTPTTPLTDWNKLEYMQQMTPEACNNNSSVAIGASKSLKDSRDEGVSYTIKKLSDGKCWMINNLRIVNKKITLEDSDVTSDYAIPASTSPWYSSNVGDEADLVHYANNVTYGAYYTWYTATAGTGTSSITSGQASGSICPKGWRLPTGGSGGEYQILYNNGHSDWTTNGGTYGYWIGGESSAAPGAVFFNDSGYVTSGSVTNLGYAYYWSSTPNDSKAYSFGFNGTGGKVIWPSGSNVRGSGYSVRCVAK